MPDTRIGAVFFDLDGTLLDTLADIAHSINSILTRHGLKPHPADAYRTMIGSGIHVAVERAAAGQGVEHLIDELAREVSDAYAADPVSRTTYYQGIEALLRELRAMDVPFAVLSNKPDHLVQLISREFFEGRGFTRVTGHVDGVPRKPDPTSALDLAQALRCGPSEVLFLGDSDIDMITARNAGMRAVGVSWGFREPEELRAAGAERILDHPDEVLRLLQGT